MSNNLQNLIYGGSFEKSTQPSGIFSNIGTPTAIARDTGDRDGHGGVYSVKITSDGSGNEGMQATLSDLKASTKYTVKVRAKVTNGDTAKIWTTGGDTNLSETTTSTAWTDVFGFFVTDSTPTDIVLNLGSDTSGDIVWFDMLMLVEGQGAFSWTPFPGEVIPLIEKYLVIGTAQLGRIAGGAPPDISKEGTFATLLFASNGTEEVFFNVHIPADWAAGTDMKLAVYWAPTSSAAGGVAWEFDWEAVGSEANETLGAGSTHVDIHDDTQSLDNELLETAYGIISGASLTVNDTIGINLYRDHDDAVDDYGADAALIHIEIEYYTDKLGEAT